MRQRRLARIAIPLAAVAMLLACAAPPAAAVPVAAWGAPFAIQSGLGSAQEPHIAVAPNGNATLVWGQFLNATRSNIWAATYDPGSGWATAVNLTNGAFNARNARVAIDSQGVATVVWWNSAFGNYSVWADRYHPGSGWDAPQLLPGPLGNGTRPLVAAGASGEAFVLFQEYNDTEAHLIVDGYSAAGALLAPQVVQVDNATHYGFPIDLAAGPDGTAAASWATFDLNGTFNGVWVATRTVASGWDAALELAVDPLNASTAKLAVAGGNVYAAFSEANGSIYSPVLRTFAAASGWSAPSAIPSPAFTTSVWKLVADDGGNITLAMVVGSVASKGDLYGGRFNAGSGWDAPVALDTGPEDTGLFAMAADGLGNAFLAWQGEIYDAVNFTATYFGLNVTRYVAHRGFQTPVDFGLPGHRDFSPTVGAAASGSAFLIWADLSTGYDVTASAFTRPAMVPMLLLDPVPGLTNSTTISVSGRTEVGALVYVDGAAAAVDGGGNFGVTLTFAEGDHTVAVVAYDTEGNEADASLSFTVDAHAELTVFSPPDHASVNSSIIVVTGRAEPGAVVRVNFAVVPVDTDGSFSATVVLAGGPNMIDISAVDAAGNRASASLNVTFVDPSVALSAQLAATQAALSGAQGDLAAAQARLAALEAAGNATQAQLASARANVTAATDRVTDLETRLESAEIAEAEAAAKADAADRRAAQADAAAISASGVAMVGVVFGAVGIAVGGLALVRAGRRDDKEPKDDRGAKAEEPKKPDAGP